MTCCWSWQASLGPFRRYFLGPDLIVWSDTSSPPRPNKFLTHLYFLSRKGVGSIGHYQRNSHLRELFSCHGCHLFYHRAHIPPVFMDDNASFFGASSSRSSLDQCFSSSLCGLVIASTVISSLSLLARSDLKTSCAVGHYLALSTGVLVGCSFVLVAVRQLLLSRLWFFLFFGGYLHGQRLIASSFSGGIIRTPDLWFACWVALALPFPSLICFPSQASLTLPAAVLLGPLQSAFFFYGSGCSGLATAFHLLSSR